jgi:hypothetical protein
MLFMNDKEYYSTSEIAAMLDHLISARTVYRWLANGQIKIKTKYTTGAAPSILNLKDYVYRHPTNGYYYLERAGIQNIQGLFSEKDPDYKQKNMGDLDTMLKQISGGSD